MNENAPTSPEELQLYIRQLLHILGIPVHRVGFRLLCTAMVLYCRNDATSLTKELYPEVAARFGYHDWHAVEHAIRLAILHGWQNQTTAIWHYYFPHCRKAPSNKQFIATLAEFL